MALFTPDQLKRVRDIIRRYHLGLGFAFFGPEAAAESRKELEDAGLIDPDAPDLIEDPLAYGQLVARLAEADVDVAEATPKRVEQLLEENPAPPLNAAEKAARDTAARHAGQYMVGLGDRVTADVMKELTGKEASLTPDEIREIVREETAENRARRESVANLKKHLGGRVQNWTRDWQRIATTETNNAIQEGTAQTIEADFDDDELVSKVPRRRGACPDCNRLYLGPDGEPAIFKLSELRANGSNVGRKRAEWLPVVEAVHPWCGCTLVRVPAGMVWISGELMPRSLAEKSMRDQPDLLKAGPFIGPRGGKWADAKHTIPWTGEHRKALFHSTPAHGMESVQEHGLQPRKGAGLFQHGGYDAHSQDKVFLSDNPDAARDWHGKVQDQLFHQHDDEEKHDAVALRVKHQRTSLDEVGDKDVSGSRYVKRAIPADHLEYHDKEHGWRPIAHWEPGRHSDPDDLDDDAMHHPGTEAHRIVAKRKADDARQEEARKRGEQARAQVDADTAARKAEWQAKTVEEREAKAAELNKPAGPIPSMTNLKLNRWMEVLGVDEHGKVLKKALTGSPYELHYRTTFQGLPISVENRKGSLRHWKDRHGNEGATKMEHPYGYIRGTQGADDDEIDVYIGPDDDAQTVYVVHQRRKLANGKFGDHDEDKVMLGFPSAGAAKRAFLAHYNDPGFFGSMDPIHIDRFRTVLERNEGKRLRLVKHVEDDTEDEPFAKAYFAIGTVRRWKDGKWYQKIDKKKWKEVAAPSSRRKAEHRELHSALEDLFGPAETPKPKKEPVTAKRATPAPERKAKEPATAKRATPPPERKKRAAKPAKLTYSDVTERYKGEEQKTKLRAFGNYLQGVHDGGETRDATGFNQIDGGSGMGPGRWDNLSPDATAAEMMSILRKYKGQLQGKFGDEEYFKAGLGDPQEHDFTAEPRVKLRGPFRGVNFGLSGFLGKPLFAKLREVQQKHGLDYDRDARAGYIKANKLRGFDWDAFTVDMADIGIAVDEMPEVPEEWLQERPEQDAPETFTAEEVVEGLRARTVNDKVAVRRLEDGSFVFNAPYSSKFNELFSNKSGKLSGITEYKRHLDHGRVTFDLALVEEAMEKLKALHPDWEIVTDGVKEAQEERERRHAELQKPIPEVQSKLAEGFALFPYQNEMVRFLDETDGKALVGDEMGLGKTLQSLAYVAKNNRRVLVVVPKVVRRTWLEEAEKFFPGHFKGKELIAAELRKNKGEQPDLSDVNIATINYESLEKFRPAIEAAGFDTIIVDESHRMKNPKAKTTQTIQSIAKGMKHRILLSGTAVKNKREELFTQLQLVKPGLFGSKNELKQTTIGGTWNKMREVYLARQKRKVLKDLPEKSTTVMHVSGEGRKYPDIPGVEKIREYRASLVEQGLDPESEEFSEEMESFVSHLEESGGMKLAIGDFSGLKARLAKAKAADTVDMAKEILASSDSSILVFSDSVEAAKTIQESLGDAALLHHGQMSDEKREAAKKEFQREGTTKRVFVSTRQSLAVGATLTAADKVIFNDLPWTAADVRQAEDRAHRVGQKNNVNVYWVTVEDNKFDEGIADIVKRKYDLSRKVNEGAQITAEEREWMETPLRAEDVMAQIAGRPVGPDAAAIASIPTVDPDTHKPASPAPEPDEAPPHKPGTSPEPTPVASKETIGKLKIPLEGTSNWAGTEGGRKHGRLLVPVGPVDVTREQAEWLLSEAENSLSIAEGNVDSMRPGDADRPPWQAEAKALRAFRKRVRKLLGLKKSIDPDTRLARMRTEARDNLLEKAATKDPAAIKRALLFVHDVQSMTGEPTVADTWAWRRYVEHSLPPVVLSRAQETLEKAYFAIGTIRRWKDGKWYRKVTPKKWQEVAAPTAKHAKVHEELGGALSDLFGDKPEVSEKSKPGRSPKAAMFVHHASTGFRHLLVQYQNPKTLRAEAKARKEHVGYADDEVKRLLTDARGLEKDLKWSTKAADARRDLRALSKVKTDDDVAKALDGSLASQISVDLIDYLKGKEPRSQDQADNFHDYASEERAHTEMRDTSTRKPTTVSEKAIAEKHGLGSVRIDPQLPKEVRAHLTAMTSNAFDDLAEALGDQHKLFHRGLAVRVSSDAALFADGFDMGARYIHGDYDRGPRTGVDWDQDSTRKGRGNPPTLQITGESAHALAHEFGHALDHGTVHAPKDAGHEPFHAALRKLSEAIRASPMADRAREHGKGPEARANYWDTPSEMFARTFEQYVGTKLARKGRFNALLTKPRYDANIHDGVFHGEDEFAKLEPLIDKMLDAARSTGILQKALEAFTGDVLEKAPIYRDHMDVAIFGPPAARTANFQNIVQHTDDMPRKTRPANLTGTADAAGLTVKGREKLKKDRKRRNKARSERIAIDREALDVYKIHKRPTGQLANPANADGWIPDSLRELYTQDGKRVDEHNIALLREQAERRRGSRVSEQDLWDEGFKRRKQP